MKPSSSSPQWSGWLLFALLLVVPPSVVAAFSPTVTRNPFVASGLLLLYGVLIGVGAVIKKMWELRGDVWIDAGTGRLEKGLRLLLANASHRYLLFFRYEHADLDMKGISTRGTYTLDLEQVFVEVRLDPTPAHKASTDPIRLPSELRRGTHDVWDYLTLWDQHLVILGSPGSGKTTLLKHLGLRMIQDCHQGLVRVRRIPWDIPLFLPIREHSSMFKGQPTYSLIEAANHQIQKWKQAIPSEWIEYQLHKGRCLILLDGLDEVADAQQRQGMGEWIQQQMLAYPKNSFVITSRPLGYRQTSLSHVAVLAIQSFTFKQIARFLHIWYQANEIKRAGRDDPRVRMKGEEEANDLLQRLRTAPNLFAMAVNPLLLTMIATVHLYYGKLPGARITL